MTINSNTMTETLYQYKPSDYNFSITDLWCYNPSTGPIASGLRVKDRIIKENISDNVILPVLGSRPSCEISLKEEKRQIRSGVIFIIENSDVEKVKFLVVKGQRKNGNEGIWSLPKGRASYEGENPETCAIREVYEETGIKLSTLSGLLMFKISHNIYYKYITTDTEFSEFHIQDVSEVEKVEWKTIAELRNLNCNKDLRSILLYPTKNFTYHKCLFLGGPGVEDR